MSERDRGRELALLAAAARHLLKEDSERFGEWSGTLRGDDRLFLELAAERVEWWREHISPARDGDKV